MSLEWVASVWNGLLNFGARFLGFWVVDIRRVNRRCHKKFMLCVDAPHLGFSIRCHPSVPPSDWSSGAGRGGGDSPAQARGSHGIQGARNTWHYEHFG